MPYLVIFVCTVVGLLYLPMLRSWLWERRLAVSAKRTFKYGMAAGQRGRREKLIAQYASQAIVYIPDIGVILGDIYDWHYRYGGYFEMFSYIHQWGKDTTVFRERFRVLEVCYRYCPGWGGYAMLVDTGEGGLDVLLSRLEHLMERKFLESWYRYIPLRVADPKKFIMMAMDV
jgi:hypothetical protein